MNGLKAILILAFVALMLTAETDGQKKGSKKRGGATKKGIFWQATDEQEDGDCETSYGEDGSGLTTYEGRLLSNQTFLEVILLCDTYLES